MRLTGLHLLITYRCTYACDHCFVWGSPDLQETMTVEQLGIAIDQAAELGTVDMVYFEGGEPTLAYPILLEAAARVRSHGLEVGLVTNCFWATSPEDAELWLRPFAALGISDLSLSSYPYSGEKGLPPIRLRNALQAARRLRLPGEVLRVGAGRLPDELETDQGDAADIRFRGRAAVELAPAAARFLPSMLTSCPHEDLGDPGRVHLGADGELQVCQGLSAGNAWREGLRTVVERYDPLAMPIFRDLLAGGPWALAQAAGLEPLRSLYADECHLCYEVRSRLRERFPRMLAPAVCYGPPTRDSC